MRRTPGFKALSLLLCAVAFTASADSSFKEKLGRCQVYADTAGEVARIKDVDRDDFDTFIDKLDNGIKLDDGTVWRVPNEPLSHEDLKAIANWVYSVKVQLSILDYSALYLHECLDAATVGRADPKTIWMGAQRALARPAF